MKRINNIFNLICELTNIEEADDNARKGKHNIGIVKHDLHKEEDNNKLPINIKLKKKYGNSKKNKFNNIA